MKPKPEVGQVWEWLIRPKEFWIIISIKDDLDCKIKKLSNKRKYSSSYTTALFQSNDSWKFMGNNSKILKILYG